MSTNCRVHCLNVAEENDTRHSQDSEARMKRSMKFGYRTEIENVELFPNLIRVRHVRMITFIWQCDGMPRAQSFIDTVWVPACRHVCNRGVPMER